MTCTLSFIDHNGPLIHGAMSDSSVARTGLFGDYTRVLDPTYFCTDEVTSDFIMKIDSYTSILPDSLCLKL